MELAVRRLQPEAKLPEFAHPTDAGMDLFSVEDKLVAGGERTLVATGIAMAIPAGQVGLIWDKSGLATKAGLTTLAGVIDSGYRGELLIAILNTSDQPYRIAKGQKIAQLLIQPINHPVITTVETLPTADRGERGFGSTGIWLIELCAFYKVS